MNKLIIKKLKILKLKYNNYQMNFKHVMKQYKNNGNKYSKFVKNKLEYLNKYINLSKLVFIQNVINKVYLN